MEGRQKEKKEEIKEKDHILTIMEGRQKEGEEEIKEQDHVLNKNGRRTERKGGRNKRKRSRIKQE